MWQLLAEESSQLLARRRGRGTRYEVGDQPRLAGQVLPGQHEALTDGGMAAQRRLDLSELDPEPTNLDLVVRSTQELDGAVRMIAGEIARPVQPRAGAGREGVGHELLGG